MLNLLSLFFEAFFLPYLLSAYLRRGTATYRMSLSPFLNQEFVPYQLRFQFCSRLCARVNTAKDRAHQLTKAFAQLDSQGGEGSFGEQQLFVDFSLEKKNINRLDFLKR